MSGARRLLLAWAFAAWAAGPAAALGASGKGTTGAAFLTLTPGARAEALGGAFGGVADDALAAHYNPAGLGALERIEAAAGREARFAGMTYDYATLAVPALAWTESTREATELGVLAASVYSLAATGAESRGTTETDAPTGTFGAGQRAYALSYGLDLGAGLSVGGTLKYVDENLASARGHASSGDAGALLRRDRWSVGGGIRNGFGRLSLGASSDPLPLVAYVGAGVRPWGGWLASVEYDQPRADASVLAFGLEKSVPVSPGLSAAARAGYRTDRTDVGGLGGASFGFGIGWKGLDADFSWSPGGMLGDVFQYSVRARF